MLDNEKKIYFWPKVIEIINSIPFIVNYFQSIINLLKLSKIEHISIDKNLHL